MKAVRKIGRPFKPEKFDSVKDAVAERNFRTFANFLIVSSFASFIAAAVIGIFGLHLVFLLLVLGISVLWLIGYFSLRRCLVKYRNLTLALFYLTESIIMAFGIVWSTFLNPNTNSIIIIALICLIPQLILDYHWRSMLFLGLVCGIYVLCCYYVKPYNVFLIDMGYLILFYPIAIVVNISSYDLRLNNVMKTVELTRLAEIDSLTGISNRGIGISKIIALLSNNAIGGFFIVDIDNFKSINDSYGHIAGDKVLKDLSAVISSSLKSEGDFVFRLGGDEFAVWVAGVKTQIEMGKLLDEIIREVSNIIISSAKQPAESHMAVSIGCVLRDGSMKHFNDIYEKADNNLYMAKENGKNRYIISR